MITAFFSSRFNALNLQNVDVFLQRLFKNSTTLKVLISTTDAFRQSDDCHGPQSDTFPLFISSARVQIA